MLLTKQKMPLLLACLATERSCGRPLTRYACSYQTSVTADCVHASAKTSIVTHDVSGHRPMGVLKKDARLACVDLSNYAERKVEITKQLMEAATTVGYVLRVLKVLDLDFPKHSEVALGTRTTELQFVLAASSTSSVTACHKKPSTAVSPLPRSRQQ